MTVFVAERQAQANRQQRGVMEPRGRDFFVTRLFVATAAIGGSPASLAMVASITRRVSLKRWAAVICLAPKHRAASSMRPSTPR
jgi:Tfp pilus assembly protein PilV